MTNHATEPVELESLLESRFRDYKSLASIGEVFGAAARLGEIVNCLRNHVRSEKLRLAWSSRIAAIELSAIGVSRILDGVQSYVARIVQILGVDSKFEYEEILWVVTMRVEVSMAVELLVFHRIDVSSVDTSAADDAMGEFFDTSDGRRLLREASLAAKRNWGIPLTHKWIG